MADLFVGSEGTLGIVLEATLRLVEMPRARALLVVEFVDLLEALAAVPAILAHQPAAVEVMDRTILDANARAATTYPRVPRCLGAIEVSIRHSHDPFPAQARERPLHERIESEPDRTNHQRALLP